MIANPKIFKAYDIRGEWNKDWDSHFVYRIGQGLFANFRPEIVAIGYDMRSSSPEMFKQLSKALTEQGVNVIDLGLCGTELTYFATCFLPKVDLGIMITASHNLGKDNGMKVTLKGGISIGVDSGLDKVRDFALAENNLTPKDSFGGIEKIDLWQDYWEFVRTSSEINLEMLKPMKIVVDAGNGIGGYMFNKTLSSLPIEIIPLFWEPDGNFPNHLADPFQESNTNILKARVIAENADFGIAYDGDGDRLFCVDNKGRYIPGYYFAALMTDYLLEKQPSAKNETIAHDPRYYWATKDVIKKHGATPIKSKVGHTLIKSLMRKNNSLLSIECSGHTFYRRTNFVESSMLSTLLLIKLVSEKGELSSLVDHYFKEYPISGEVNFIVENTKEILQKIEERYSGGNISKLDGVGIDFSHWRFNIRCSNTQPLLRLNVEAKTKELVTEKFEELKELIGGTIADH